MAKKAREIPVCQEVYLPEEDRYPAALEAIRAFPPNAPARMTTPAHIAVLTSKYWGKDGADLTVGFMERPSAAFIAKLIEVANRWNTVAGANVRFRHTNDLSQAVIRISTARGGYWSYLGRDCLSIARNKQTMNLEGFSTRTGEAEWLRVVCHEFGHALGCPHEHQRQEIIDQLDAEKVIAEFMRSQGWSREEVIQQILVPLEERSLTGASPADPTSLMAYQFSGRLTKSGKPIPGGPDFSPIDRQYIARIYPKATAPEPPPPPTGEGISYVAAFDASGKELHRWK